MADTVEHLVSILDANMSASAVVTPHFGVAKNKQQRWALGGEFRSDSRTSTDITINHHCGIRDFCRGIVACGDAVDFVECMRGDGVFAIETFVLCFQGGTTAGWIVGSQEIARQAAPETRWTSVNCMTANKLIYFPSH
jgi:hypothetical protein